MSSRATPRYFGPADRPLFGWVHHAPRPSSLGLVVCNPFGYESICAHRSLRHFCAAAAAAGIPALRFDYDGTGDSAGDDREPGRLKAWVASVDHAIDLLRKDCGVSRVAVLGVRLGALVAALAAATRDDVEGLIAIAPVVVGRAYMRELRALECALDRPAPPRDAMTTLEEGLEGSVGFALTAETKRALVKVDLTLLAEPPAPSVLLIDREDLPSDNAWAEHLSSQGVTVGRQCLPGYVEMMLGPQEAKVPEAMIRTVTDWLLKRAAAMPSAAAMPVESPTDASARARLSAFDAKATVIESAASVDAERRLFGILSTPEAPPPARRGIVLLNGGAVHHVGSNRLHVRLARRWAALGHAVLRMDSSGIGDSQPRPGDPENVIYSPRASEDIAAASAFLRRQPGVVEVHALGLCSGGYSAFKAAVAGVPLDGVLLINPLTFFFKPGMPLEIPQHLAVSETLRYSRRLRSPDAWKKLLRGQIRFDAVARLIRRRLTDIARGRARYLARRVGMPITHDLESELESLIRRDTCLRFLFAGGDPGITLLSDQGGRTVTKLRRRGKLELTIIDGADHTFTPLWSQAALEAKLGAYFDGPTTAKQPVK